MLKRKSILGVVVTDEGEGLSGTRGLSRLKLPTEEEGQPQSLRVLWTQAKKASKEESWAEAEKVYRQILKEIPNNVYATRGLGWVYYKWNKVLLEQGESSIKLVRRNLWRWLSLNDDKTDMLYGLMLLQAKKLAEIGKLKMHVFLQWWNTENFQPKHWEKWENDKKNKFDGIAIQVIRIAAKEVTIKNEITPEIILRTTNWVNTALRHDPENLWLIYYKGKLLLRYGESTEAIKYFKNVVQQKLQEGWAWSYLAEAMEQNRHPLTLACICKAIILSPLEKSIRARSHLVKLLLNKKNYDEAKAVVLQILKIAENYSVHVPEDIKRIEKLQWYINTNPVANIENWIQTQSTKAINIFTAHLPWIPGCIGTAYINAKQKPRLNILFKDGQSTTVSATAFNLQEMKPGDPIEIKKEEKSTNKIIVLQLRKRNGSSWDIAKIADAIVVGINQKSKGFHFVGVTKNSEEAPQNFFCPFSITKEKLKVGDSVNLFFISKEKNFVLEVKKIKDLTNNKLLKMVHSPVEFISPNRSFGKLKNDIFLSNTILANYKDITEYSIVSGIAVPNFDRKKNIWGWVLLKVKSIDNNSLGTDMVPTEESTEIASSSSDAPQPITINKDSFVLDEQTKSKRLRYFSQEKLVLFIGATGVGKSSLINAIIKISHFPNIPFARTGLIDPVTHSLDKYQFQQLTIFDSPGFGQAEEDDIKNTKLILNWLKENQKFSPIIVVVLDANVREYGSTFELLNKIKLLCNKFIFCINRVDALFPVGVFDNVLSSQENLSEKENKKITEKVDSVINRMVRTVEINAPGVATSAQTSLDPKLSRCFHIERLLDIINSL